MNSSSELLNLLPQIRSLLHDYLATDGDALYNLRDGSSRTVNVFRDTTRDKNKVGEEVFFEMMWKC
jgi:hypothetical protein